VLFHRIPIMWLHRDRLEIGHNSRTDNFKVHQALISQAAST
jgi:hypothetical protein